MQPQAGNRISNAIAKASGAFAAILGFVALAGWILELPVLVSLGQGWIPMAPSTALLFVLCGTAMFFSARVPLSRAAHWTGVSVGAAVAVIGLLLFFLSYLGIRLEAEHLGFAISGTVGEAPIGHMSPATALCFLLAGLSLVATLKSSPNRQGQAIAGFWLAGLMVFASVVFLLTYLFSTPLLYGGKYIPPALTTSLGLAALGAALLALAGSQAWAPDQQIDAETLRASRSFVLVFLLMTIGLATAGGVYFRSHVKQHRAEIELQLSAIADLKVSELVNWRMERFGDGMLLYGNPIFADLVRRALGSSRDAHARDQLENWLRQIREAYHGYAEVSMMDAEGVARISVPDKSLAANELETARQALRSGQITLNDFHRNEPGGAPRLSLLVPILDDAAGDRPLGIVMLEIDPAKYLYPFIARWPTLSSSAETLLVRRDGNDVLYLNELRFRKNTALSLRFPLTRTEIPAVKAVLGQEGIVVGTDYRGVPVIAAVRAVPGTPWFLVARMDTDEFLASTEESLWLMAGLVAALLLFSGATLGFIWRHQRVRHYSERTRAAEALAEGAARYRAVTQTAADSIVTADSSGIIVGWNASAERLFGYAEIEVIGQPLTLLMPERFRDRHLDGMKRLQSSGERRVIGKTVELVGRRKDAREFPLDLSLAEWTVGEDQFFTGNIRDITERKEAEKNLRASESRFRQMAENIRDVFFLRDADSNRMLYVSPAYEEIWGRSRESLYAHPESWIESIHPDDRASAYEKNKQGILARKFQMEYRIVRPDGSIRWIESRGFPVRDDAGTIVRITGVVEDITERKQAEAARQFRAAELEESQRIARIGSWAWTIATGDVTWSDGMNHVLARDRALPAPTFETLQQFYTPESWQRLGAAIANTIETGAPYDLELEMIRADAATCWTTTRGEAIRGPDGTVVKLRGTVHDITESKQAAQALRDSEARFRSLTEMSSDYYWESDGEHRLTRRDSVGKAGTAGTVLAFLQTAWIGERRWDIPYLSPDEAGWQAHRAVLDAHRPFRDFEFSRLGSDGTEWHISISGDPVFGESGAFKGYRGVGTDITERKRAESALRASEDRNRDLVENSAVLICTHDLEGKLLSVNAAMARFTEYSQEALLRMSVADLLTRGARDRFAAYLAEIRTKGTARGLMQIRTADGKTRWWEYHNTLRTEGVAAPVVRGMGEDVTERKRAEDALQQEHASLLKSQQELLNAHESLAKADRLESVGRLAAGVAHEVKNPLTIIRLGTDYLAKQFSQASNQELFDKVRAAIDRAEHVIRDLLEFSRQNPFAPRPTNIDEVIDNAINLIKHEIERRNIVIIRNRNDPMPSIYADPDRLVQIFINVLTNAAHSIGQNGSIEIVTRSICLSERDLERAEASTLRIGEPVIAVEIRDNGPGISAEHEKKLFEPFFTTKPVGEGSGLGLAVSRNIMIMHRGSISISNRPEGGASALLMFRVDREHLTNEEANTGSR
jgi:PAS domain S-box-containing protein